MLQQGLLLYLCTFVFLEGMDKWCNIKNLLPFWIKPQNLILHLNYVLISFSESNLLKPAKLQDLRVKILQLLV